MSVEGVIVLPLFVGVTIELFPADLQREDQLQLPAVLAAHTHPALLGLHLGLLQGGELDTALLHHLLALHGGQLHLHGAAVLARGGHHQCDLLLSGHCGRFVVASLLGQLLALVLVAC